MLHSILLALLLTLSACTGIVRPTDRPLPEPLRSVGLTPAPWTPPYVP